MKGRNIIYRPEEPNGNLFDFIQTKIDIAALVYILGAGFII